MVENVACFNNTNAMIEGQNENEKFTCGNKKNVFPHVIKHHNNLPSSNSQSQSTLIVLTGPRKRDRSIAKSVFAGGIKI
jgi:hypothetical protein